MAAGHFSFFINLSEKKIYFSQIKKKKGTVVGSIIFNIAVIIGLSSIFATGEGIFKNKKNKKNNKKKKKKILKGK
jgi:hypothetical protein